MGPKITFEPVKRIVENNIEFNLPIKKTSGSAGYDIEVIQDVIIPSKTRLMCELNSKASSSRKRYTLDQVEKLTEGLRPTIVKTGLKARFPENYVCVLAPRSSTGLKYGLRVILGIVDSDYADNKDNDGEIGFVVENNLPIDVELKKGDIIGQALFFEKFNATNVKVLENIRKGGYGSTTN